MSLRTHRPLKIAASALGATCLLLGLAALVAWQSLPNMCANTALSEATSPNGTYKAIVFVRDCGAATDYSTQVALLETDKTLEDEGGNVFVADNGHGNAPIGKNNGLFVEASWISNSLLRIEHDSRVRIFKTEALMHGVKIEYVQARNDG